MVSGLPRISGVWLTWRKTDLKIGISWVAFYKIYPLVIFHVAIEHDHC